MFYSQYAAKLNAKSQLTLPAKFREAISRDEAGNTLYFLQADPRCIYIYTKRLLDEKMDRLMEDEVLMDSPDFRRLFSANVSPADFDAQGRFVLPADVRASAGIEREAIFVGNVDRIELWALERWKRVESEQAQSFPGRMRDIVAVQLERHRRTDR